MESDIISNAYNDIPSRGQPKWNKSASQKLNTASKKRKTRREIFLEKIDRIILWEKLLQQIEPYYPAQKTTSKGGVQPTH